MARHAIEVRLPLAWAERRERRARRTTSAEMDWSTIAGCRAGGPGGVHPYYGVRRPETRATTTVVRRKDHT